MRSILAVSLAALVVGFMTSVGSAQTTLLNDVWNISVHHYSWSTETVDTADKASGANSLRIAMAGDGNPAQAGCGVFVINENAPLQSTVDPATQALKFSYKLTADSFGRPDQTLDLAVKLLQDDWDDTSTDQAGILKNFGMLTITGDGQWHDVILPIGSWTNTPVDGQGNPVPIGAIEIYRTWWAAPWSNNLWPGGGTNVVLRVDNFQLVTTEPVYHPGDANKDGVVTDADYTLWADNYNATGATWGQGDFNKDGTVTDADYTIWADHYGHTNESPVPEPATLSLLGLGLMGLIRRRK